MVRPLRKRRLGIAAAFVVVLLTMLVSVAQRGGGYLGEGVSRIWGIASGAQGPLNDGRRVRDALAVQRDRESLPRQSG